jgi:hypothetical protein
MGELRYNSTILDLGTRWRLVVSITPRSLYARGNRSRYPLDRRLGGPQSRSGRCGEETNLAMAGLEPLPSSPSLYRLNYPDSHVMTYPEECLRQTTPPLSCPYSRRENNRTEHYHIAASSVLWFSQGVSRCQRQFI